MSRLHVRHGPAALALGVVCYVLAQTAPVAARARAFSLNWVRDTGAESCITSRELAELVERVVGNVFVIPSEAELSIEGHVQREPHGAGWSARIVVSDRSGQVLGVRNVASTKPDCHALNVQIGLVVALAVDPEAALDAWPSDLLEQLKTPRDPAADLLAQLQHEQAAKPAQPEPVPVAPPRPQPSAAARAPAEPPAEIVSISLGFAAGVGFLPHLSAGPWLGASAHLSPRWTIALQSVLWLPNDAQLSAAAGPAAVHFTMSLNHVSACRALLRARSLTWDACAGIALGVRWSDGSDALDHPADTSRWDFGPALASQLGYEPFERFVVLVALALDVPLRRQAFVYRDARGLEHALFTPGPVAPWLRLGAGLNF